MWSRGVAVEALICSGNDVDTAQQPRSAFDEGLPPLASSVHSVCLEFAALDISTLYSACLYK